LKKIILIIFFPINTLFAYEVTCNFEEVYQNSEIQQGIFLIKDEMMRYQYYNQELFTIIAKNKKYFLIKNDSKIVQKLIEKTDVFDTLREIVLDFPKLKNIYKKNNLVIKIEKSTDQFIKRVSINSDEVNLSINMINCKFNEIEKKYFNHFNFVEYNG